MGDKSKRKVKEVNGWKVNHPFSFGNMFYAFLILGLVAVPIVYTFIPIVAITQDGGIVPLIYGTDLFSGFFDNIFENPSSGIQALVSLCGDQFSTIAFIMLIVQTAFIFLSIGLSVAAFVFFMITICKGYLRHPRVIRLFAVLQFLVSLLFSLVFLTIYIFIFINLGDFPNIFMWWNFVLTGALLIWMITISITYSASYKDVIYEADLEYHSDEEKDTVTHVSEVHEVTKVNYEPSNVLPPNIESIGGHAFAENQYLEIANIPVGIESLGAGAFANCLKLKVVSLPESVKEIGFNCFFNCVSLERINFAGSKEQWRHIKRGSNWLAKSKTTQVVCVDGPIVVNPYH